jgi:cytochrome c oxidase subunit II
MSVPRAAARRTCEARPRRRLGASLALLVTTLVLAGCEAGASYPQTTFRPVSAFGDALNQVFYNTVGWTMAILILVMGLILYATFRFRERPETPHPEQIHGNTKLEIAWTIAPALIVVFIGVPTVQTIFETQRRPPDDALVVEVIGHQWWWEFRYPEYGVVTANQMWIPTDRPVSLQMHASDVIHSFWVPKIGGKRDVNPLPRVAEGQPAPHKNYLLFNVRDPGHYLGQCAEFCGESHAIMRFTVMAVEEPEFQNWISMMRGQTPAPMQAMAAADAQMVADTAQVSPADAAQVGAADTAQVGQAVDGQPAALTAQPAEPGLRIGQIRAPTGAGNPFVAPFDDVALQREGERIFLGAACVACHQISGTTAAGLLGPALTRYGERPWVGAGAAANNMENLVQWIRDPQSMKPGTLMPGTIRGGGGMAPTGLSDAEVRAVAAYLLSLK